MSTGGTKAYGSSSDVSYEAEAAMATNYTAVKLGTSADQVNISTANTEVVVGITQIEQATANQLVTVRTKGFSLARAGGSISKGDKLTPSTGGSLVATTTAAHKVCAIAIEAADTSDIFEVLLVTPSLRYDSF